MKSKTQLRLISSGMNALKWILMVSAIFSFIYFAINKQLIYLFCGVSAVIMSFYSYKLRGYYIREFAKRAKEAAEKDLLANKPRRIRRKFNKKKRYKTIKTPVKAR